MKYTPQGDLTLTGRYTLSGGLMKYALPVIAAKEFAIDNGSYVEWTGEIRWTRCSDFERDLTVSVRQFPKERMVEVVWLISMFPL